MIQVCIRVLVLQGDKYYRSEKRQMILFVNYYLFSFILVSVVLSNFSMGRLKVNVAPLPSLLFTAPIFPPWDSTILFARKRPSPVPFADLVANLVKSLG